MLKWYRFCLSGSVNDNETNKQKKYVMKTSLKIFALGLVLVGFGMNVNAQSGTSTLSTGGTAAANVVKALTMAQSTPMDFGTFAGLAGATSTVVLATSGSRSASTADIVGGNGVAGEFLLTGQSGSLVSITMPTSVTNLIGTGAAVGGDNMTITATTGWITDQANLASVTLTGGSITLKVGATLNVGIDQKVGPYAGTYTISVNYN